MATPLSPTATLDRGGEVRHSTYVEHAAPAGSGALVACAWVGVPGWDHSIRVLPDGCVDVSWDGTAVTLTPGGAAARRVDVRAGGVTVGVRLHPAAASVVAGRVVPELHEPVPLRELWSSGEVARLGDALADLGPARATEALAMALVAHVQRAGREPDRRLHVAIDQLRRPATSVAQAASAVGWSARQLRRRCVEDVGLAPKPLQQVLRFHAALQRLGTEPVARTAAATGYADQAHLSRACRRHAGSSPAALVRQLRA